jgi:hypothetical protein
MKPGLLLAALLVTLPGAAPRPHPRKPPPPTAEERRQARLMDEIETRLALPPGAQPLSHYARFYAFEGPGKVIAVYMIPEPARPAGDHCVEMTADGNSHPVACEPSPAWPPGVPAGHRRWVRDRREMPLIFDGGCIQITITYDLKSRKIESASCNGYA